MSRLRLQVLVFAVIAMGACSSNPEVADDDEVAAGGGGAPASVGGSGGTGGSTSSGLPDTCDGTCQQLDVAIDFGNGERKIERAFYGLTVVANEPPRLYVELSRGGGATCPTMSSPTPERLVLLHDIPIPETPTTLTDADGITAQYFDFVGDDLPSAVQTPALTIEVTPRAIDVCSDCVGQASPSDPDGFFALDVSLTFDGGSAMGSAYATHCDSLDTVE